MMIIAKNGLMKRIMIIMFAISLMISITYQIPVHAASDVTVNVDATTTDGVSGLSLGITHTSLMWEQGDPAAVTLAKNLLIPAVKYQNQHIMGFGADNPQPTAGGPFNFSSLDSRIQLMRSIGGDMVITFCTAPGWMKTSGQDWNMADRVADAHITDFANLSAAIAQQYPDIKYFQIWNEFKGYWDSSIKNSDGSTGNFDYVRYTQMYNAVYAAVKKVRPDAKVGGFYLPLGGDGSNTLGYIGDGTYTPIGTKDMDSLNYWLTNKVGADFICVDFGLIDWFNPNHLTATDGLALTWTYKKIIQDIEAKTNLPIWYSEYYSLPDAAYNGSPWVAATMASIYYNMIKGEGTTPITALLWNPEEGEESCPHYLFTSTTPATGGQPTPHYNVYKGMHDYFPSGTQLYKATSSDPNVEVLASADKTMLINKYNTAKSISVNGVEYTLAAYEVRFVNTPPVKVDDSDSQIYYIGIWSSDSSSLGYYKSTKHYVNETTTMYDAASLSFTGKSVSWVFSKGPDRGNTDVYIDDQWVTTVYLYSNTIDTPTVLFSTSWSTAGNHSIKIVALNEKNTLSTNYYSGLDYFQYGK